MFDDRLEILSPGKLPNIVTLENMKKTRFSRNFRIARFLSDFGWVKELNEGVNRIYAEMKDCFLEEPAYDEPNNNSVRLVLYNNINTRHLRADDKLSNDIYPSIWNELTENEKNILHYLYSKGKINTKETVEYLQKSSVTSRRILQTMLKKQLLEWHGCSTNDPRQYYTLKDIK